MKFYVDVDTEIGTITLAVRAESIEDAKSKIHLNYPKCKIISFQRNSPMQDNMPMRSIYSSSFMGKLFQNAQARQSKYY